MASYVVAGPSSTSVPTVAGAVEGGPRRRFRREATTMGPRCPHCAGPLVFGEGCSICPICGYSGCSL